jgi:hypothetical protein
MCFPLVACVVSRTTRRTARWAKQIVGRGKRWRGKGIHAAANFEFDSELGGAFDRTLVCFDHAERGPLLGQFTRLLVCAQADGGTISTTKAQVRL